MIVREYLANITFSNHALNEMLKDSLTITDVWNVLKAMIPKFWMMLNWKRGVIATDWKQVMS